jgi:hypothetical protein
MEEAKMKSLKVVVSVLAIALLIGSTIAYFFNLPLSGYILWFAVPLCIIAVYLSLPRVKDEEKEKLQEFAYDVGLERGREMGKGLEENWKSHVIAAVIAMSCGLLLISLNSVWYIVGLSTFISYGIAYYSLSKLSMKIKRGTKRK